LQNFDGGRMEWRILEADTLEFTDFDPGVVVALYDTDLEKEFDLLSASGGMAIKTISAAIAAVTAIAFILAISAIAFLECV
jgi:hypothetical protein